MWLTIGFIVSIISNVVLIIFGLLKFIEQENIKRIMTNKSYIHNLRFEKEFNIYVELWDKIIDFRNTIQVLRPIFEMVDTKKSEEERDNEKIMKAIDATNVIIGLTQKNKPFYDEEIFNRLQALNKLSRNEIHVMRYKDLYIRRESKDETYSFWEDGEKAMAEFETHMDAICSTIRSRIQYLTNDDTFFLKNGKTKLDIGKTSH